MSQQQSKTKTGDSDDDYKRTTLYLRQDVKRQYERWQLRLELEHTLVEDAYKRELHEALIAVAMNNPDDFIEYLTECVGDPDKFEVIIEELAK